VEARLRRIAGALPQQRGNGRRGPTEPSAGQEDSATCASDDLLAYVFRQTVQDRLGAMAAFATGASAMAASGMAFPQGGGFRNSGETHHRRFPPMAVMAFGKNYW